MRVADVVFAVVVVATFVCYYVKSRYVVLNGDDWVNVPRGNTFIDYFKPYQSNLSIVPIAVYHFVFTVFGFGAYWPLRVAGLASNIAVGVAVYLIVRSRWGAAVALVAGVAVLWYPISLLTPSLFNHWLSLTGCLVAGWALTFKPGRSDWIVAIALTFALCSSSVGVAGAAGCLAYVALSRAPLRRWLVVGIPSALFVVWWFTLASDDHGQSAHQPLFERGRYMFDGVTNSFQLLAPGGRWLGIPLAIAFLACIAWQLRGGVRAAAMGLAWTFAILVWWTGLAFTRLGVATGSPDSVRYRIVTCSFALLALSPLAKSPKVRRLATDRRALAVALVASIAVVAINGPGIFQRADFDGADYRQQTAKMVVLNLGPSVVPDNVMVHFDLWVAMSARRYRTLVDKYGAVPGTRPAHPDQAIARLTDIKPVPVDDPVHNCTRLRAPTKVPGKVDIRHGVNQATRVVLQAPSSDTTVQIRRYETSWVTVGVIPAGTTVALDLPVLFGQAPWVLQADGACQVQR